MEQKTFLKSFVKKIDASNSEVTINYTLPMTSLNVDKETVAVLGLIQNGGLTCTIDRTFGLTFLPFVQ